MTDIELRLECLKLTYTHGRLAAEAVDRAKVLEDYVKNTGSAETPVKQKTLTLPSKKPPTSR